MKNEAPNISENHIINEDGWLHQTISQLETSLLTEGYPEQQEQLLDLANKVALSKLKRGQVISSPADSRKSIRDLLQMKQEEVMSVLFLDTKNRIICFEELFHGSINSAMVYTRVLVKKALEYNSGAIILAHNHPSGVSEPSREDIAITERIYAAMELIEVRLLDHFVVSVEGIYSFAEHGQINGI